MIKFKHFGWVVFVLASGAGALPAVAQSFKVQCPNATTLHPGTTTSTRTCTGTGRNQRCTTTTTLTPDPGIKCQQISGGDGYATMADGHQIYLFGFGPLSGTKDLLAGLSGPIAGTETAAIFNAPLVSSTINDGLAAGGDIAVDSNSAIVDPQQIMNQGVMFAHSPAPTMAISEDDEFFMTLTNVGMIMRPDLFEQHTVHFHGYPNASSYFDGVPDDSIAINIAGSFTYYYAAPDAGTYFFHCHITPPEHLQMGMVGQLYVEPRQNNVTVGKSLYGALSAYYTGGPSAANNASSGWYTNHKVTYPQENCKTDFLCSMPLPPANTTLQRNDTASHPLRYAYDDGDGSTQYDVEVPIQMMGFDPNFHFVGMTFNPESFQDMKDKYFLLNGRSYPDTAYDGAIGTLGADGVTRTSQPLSAHIVLDRTGCAGGPTATPGPTCQQKVLVRLSDLDVTEMVTLGSVGVPMKVIAWSARLLRDLSGNNLYYNTNSITLGGGESADFLLDITSLNLAAGQTYTFYLYSTNLDHLSNDAENFGGMMTEILVKT